MAAVGLCVNSGYTVFDGGGNSINDAPYGVVYAENSGEEDPPDTGTFWIYFRFEVYGNAPQDVTGPDPKIAYDLMVATLFDLFMQDDLYQQLNAVGVLNFTANGVRTRGTNFAVVEDKWVTTLTMQILCSPSTLYP